MTAFDFMDRVAKKFPDLAVMLWASYNINGMFIVPPVVWNKLKDAGMLKIQEGEVRLFEVRKR